MLDSNQSNCLQTLEFLAPADCTQVFSLWLTFAEPNTVNLVIQIEKVSMQFLTSFHRSGCFRMVRTDAYDAYAAIGSDA